MACRMCRRFQRARSVRPGHDPAESPANPPGRALVTGALTRQQVGPGRPRARHGPPAWRLHKTVPPLNNQSREVSGENSADFV